MIHRVVSGTMIFNFFNVLFYFILLLMKCWGVLFFVFGLLLYIFWCFLGGVFLGWGCCFFCRRVDKNVLSTSLNQKKIIPNK